MWWLDPGKEVLNVIFNRILAPYVENLDMDQVNYGIGQGQLMLKKLRLKRGALDKFRLPVDVIEGHLGTFTLSLHWRNLGNQPVEILIEDVYLLVVPSPEGDDDPEEEERRVQAAKQERLQNAELLHVQGEDVGEGGPQQQGLLESLIAKIVNNLQITIKNIHIRYEDKLSVPHHPFAAGITLAGFSAVSVDENWMPAFIESTAGSIHKLSKLESLAVYFDTDAESIAGLPYKKSVEIFARMIAGLQIAGQQDPDQQDSHDHQFMLKPVTGEGRVIMNHQLNKDTPRFDIQLLFDEIGVVLDDNQYRDIISLVDMFHFYTRQHQYRTFRPSEEELRENRPRALLRFAGRAILDGVHERNRKWTWAYFAERRDDRHRYVDLFKKKSLNCITLEESEALEELEKKLSYEDIRFYRSIARSELRKDSALRKKMEEEKKSKEAETTSSWTGWLWGSSTTADADQQDSAFHGPMTEEQRQELYDVLDFDEKRALAESFDVPRDALKMRVAANLEKGSLALKTDPHGKAVEVTSVVFHGFQATFLQRKDNFEVITDLRGLGVFDGTTSNTLYPQIVQVKHEAEAESDLASLTSPESFFHVKFENNPLDERADTALSVRMRHMEIIYHRGYVEAIYRFFKPPASQLESVEALLNVASETLEGIRRDTRAGLEYALQMHKTIDLHLDMNAPIIIIPESITTAKCKHLVVDAGHISVESDLADKEALREIQLKRNQAYTDEDYSKLESLMYDKFFLKLEDAQFVLGEDLQSCRNALSVRANDTLHLIERISIDLQVQISMVPSAVTLSRFKVSGTLPRLQVNFSDTKYKSIMRLVDVTIPKFDDGPPESKGQWPSGPGGYQLSTGLFNLASTEYTIDGNGNGEEAKSGAQSAEPEKGGIEERDLHQRVFELNFQVATLSASLSKTQDNVEKPLGVVSFDQFALSLAVAKYDLTVDVALGSLSMSLFEPDANPVEVLSSADRSHQSTNLLNVHYTRVQRESPEYQTVYEGFNQNVDIKISTVIFRAAPEPVITLYNFIMTTFVPEAKEALDEPMSTVAVSEQRPPDLTAEPPSDKIRVLVKLASVEVLLVNAQIQLATLSLSTADASVMLHANTMRVHMRLGSLALSDDSQTPVATPDFQQIMSIEGENLAEFTYQTYDPNDKETYEGIKSSVHLSAASVKLHYLQQPLHDLYLFASKLAKLKGLYDAATQAAVQRASEIERMKFDISVKSPIVVIPSDPATSKNALVMHLGEISASNSYEGDIAKAAATLRGIQLISTIYYNDAPSSIKLIDDIEITADVMHFGTIDRQVTLEQPDTQVAVNISDVKLALTQVQYEMVIALSRSIPEVLAGAPEGTAQAIDSRQVDEKVGSETNDESSIDLRPELEPSATVWSTLDVTVHVNTIRLQLYDSGAMSESTLKDHGIARFALNNSSVRLKQLSDGAMEAQVVLKSFTMSNTRPGNSKFREVIPAAHHDRNQFMILYTSSGGTSPTSFVILTIDSPHVIFAIDPVFALADFFLSAFPPSDTSAETHMSTPSTRALAPEKEEVDDLPQVSQFDFRVDVHDASVVILENDMDADSQAIKLSVAHVLVSQQGILALTVNKAGMSLTRIGKDAEAVRFLDDVDMTFTLDSRAPSALHQVTNIEISSTPIVFRASYRDIRLILAIVNKATEAYGQSNYSPPEKQVQKPQRGVHSIPQKQSLQVQLAKKGRPPSRAMGSARVLTSREQLKATFEGFRLILIGDLHEQPMLHLKVKSYVVELKDWSSQLQASTTLATSVSFWNLTNSHWEPLIDPWAFTASVSREKPSSTLMTALTSRERLNLNISTVFVELAVSVFNTWSKEGDRVLQRARGSYAPYRIRNLTGTALYIWADTDGSTEKRQVSAQKLVDGQTVDWRFDDWRTVREHASSTSQNSIAVQFLGQVWEQLRSIPVDREGEYTFALRPRVEKFYNRLLCEVKVEDNIKVVTLRSTYKVHNQTLYPLELTLIDESGNHTRSIQKIAPGRDYSLPIDLVGKSKIRIQPDQGFGYKWSPAMRWEDLIARQAFTLRCPHADETEAAFRFHAFVQTDAGSGPLRKYPKIDLRLRAPIELENLLPYNLQYRIYDKNADQNWRSYLRQGGVMPVHSVELGHLVLLNIEIQDTVFKPSDFAIINTDGNSDFDVENRLVLEDRHGRKLNLNLNYIRYPDAGGAFKVQIYSPYLLVNKTGLPFAVRSLSRSGAAHDAAGDTRKDALNTPSPFMLSRPNGTGNEFILQVDKSAWSKVINLEAPAADMELPIPSQAQKADEIHIGLSWSEGLGKYKLTKVITLSPRFLIKNNLGEAICFREHGVAPRGKFTLEPGERTAIHYMRSGYEKLLTVAFPGLDTAWSPPFSIEDIGSVHFRLKRRGDSDSSHLIRADVKMEAAVIFIFLQLADDEWPFVIENDSDYPVHYCQMDLIHNGEESAMASVPKYTLPPRSIARYAWDFPAVMEKKILLNINGARRPADIMEIGDLVPFRFPAKRGVGIVSMDVRASGRQQILRLTNYSMETSLYRPKPRHAESSLRVDTLSGSQEAFEAVTEEVPPTISFKLDFEGIGLSLINRRTIEVVYLSIDKQKFEYTSSPVAQSVNICCGSLQLDNQLHDAIFPVVLQPTPISKEARDVAALPTVQGSVIWLNDDEHGVLFIKYCSILLQALTIQADEDFLFSFYELSQIRGAFWEEGQEDVLIASLDEIPEPKDMRNGQDLYFEVLELQPIRLSLSFMRTEHVSGETKLSLRNPLAVVVNGLTMALGNVNDAALEMNALAIKDMRLTLPDLQTRIAYHYGQEVLRQLYRILGSADFIGNPVGLFTNVSSGVADIFYEPFNGAVMSGNRELGAGIAKGAASFVKKTVFGVTDSLTKVTSSIGKGLSAVTLDSEFQKRRRLAQRRNKPRHAIYGVAAGAEAFATSLASGVEGIVMKPIEGAEAGGAFGFFKGVGKGLVGVMTKPVVGALDLASSVTEGVRNTTTVFDIPARERVRLPRHVPPDNVVVAYSAREALGQYWMKDLDNGAYRNESYVAHLNLPGGDSVALLTMAHVIVFRTTNLRVDWVMPLTVIQGVTIEDNGIRFAHTTSKDQDRFIIVTDKAAQSWFFGQIALVVKAFNARRRMDS